MSFVKLHGHFVSNMSPSLRVMAMVPVIQFLRLSMNISFRFDHCEAENDVVAEAALHYLAASPSNRISHKCWQKVEKILHKTESVNSSEIAAISDVSDRSITSRKRPLEESLEQMQKRVKRNQEFDVRRGKGQGVKNHNATFYTPLIRDRAMEYASINTGNKNRNDELKHAIALDVLIKLAEKGGRVLDEDNVTILDNNKAVKKVMNALKDKAREMKRRESEESLPPQPIPSFSLDEAVGCFSHEIRPSAVASRPRGSAEEKVEPAAFAKGEPTPSEREALDEFSSYWFSHHASV